MQVNPSTSKDWKEKYEKGVVYDSSRQFVQAIECFSQIIDSHPGYYKDSIFLRGRCYTLLEDPKFESALEDFILAIKQTPDDGRCYFEKSLVLEELGRVEEAKKLFSISLSKLKEQQNHEQDNHEVHYYLGLIFDKLGQRVKAIEHFTKSIDLKKTHSCSYCHRGVVYFNQKKFRLSIADFQEALMLDPTDALSCFLIGRGYFALKEYDASTRYFVSSFKLDPGHFESMYFLARAFFMMKKYDDAISHFTSSLQVLVQGGTGAGSVKDFKNVFYYRGISFSQCKLHDKAVSDFTCCLQLDSNHYDALFFRAWANGNRGKFKESILDFSACLKIKPNDASVLYHRGLVFWRSGFSNFEAALADFQKSYEICREHYPKFVTAKGNIMMFYNRFEEAFEAYDHALRLSPNDPECLNNRGNCLKYLGRFKEAKHDLLKAHELSPTSTYIIFNIGDYYLYLLKYQKARVWFEKAVAQDPENPKIYYERATRMKFLDPERSFDDMGRFLLLSKLKGKDYTEKAMRTLEETGYWKNSLDDLEAVMHGSLMEKKVKVKDPIELEAYEFSLTNQLGPPFYPFVKDLLVDYVSEKAEIEEVTKRLKLIVNGKNMKNEVTVYRFLGRGSYGSTYLSRVKGLFGVFVLKVYHSTQGLDTAAKREMMRKEHLMIPYHRNVANVLAKSDMNDVVDIKKLPDYEKFWGKRRHARTNWSVIMKYYRKDLRSYVIERRKFDFKFSSFEACCILKGIICGLNFLHSHQIVHRDLSIGNVFVDPMYGRVYVGDFGCALDLRGNPTKFKVKKDRVNFSLSSFSSGSSSGGGWDVFLAPEIIDSKEEEEFFDYEKSDLFSVGVVAYYMIMMFFQETEVKSTAPFGTCLDLYDEEVPVVEERKQEKYQELDETMCHPKIASLIRKLLIVDQKKRIGYSAAVLEVSTLFNYFVETEEKSESSVERWRSFFKTYQNVQVEKISQIWQRNIRKMVGVIEVFVKMANHVAVQLGDHSSGFSKILPEIRRMEGECRSYVMIALNSLVVKMSYKEAMSLDEHLNVQNLSRVSDVFQLILAGKCSFVEGFQRKFMCKGCEMDGICYMCSLLCHRGHEGLCEGEPSVFNCLCGGKAVNCVCLEHKRKVNRIDGTVKNMVKAGVCTYSKTGKKYTYQRFYNCKQCGLVDGLGCCESCYLLCHKGHNGLEETVSSPSHCFCDCGDGGKCKCLKDMGDQK